MSLPSGLKRSVSADPTTQTFDAVVLVCPRDRVEFDHRDAVHQSLLTAWT